MSLSKILLLALLTLISAKNVVIIGDSRACGIANYVLGIDYTWHNSVYGTGSYIITQSGKSYDGHSIKFIAEVGASCYTFTNSQKAVSSAVYSTLNSASDGTVVLMWLGVNNLDSSAHYNYYKSIASKYPRLQFIAVSVTGVSSKADVSNDSIKKFNSYLEKQIPKSGLSNFVYKSILKNGNPTEIYNYSQKTVTFTVTGDTTDYYGVHYNTNGYKAILNAMLSIM